METRRSVTGTPDPDTGTPDPDTGTPDRDTRTPDPDTGTPASVTGTPDRDAHRLRTGLLSTAALVGLLLAIGLSVPSLRDALEPIAHATPGWLVLALGLELASCL